MKFKGLTPCCDIRLNNKEIREAYESGMYKNNVYNNLFIRWAAYYNLTDIIKDLLRDPDVDPSDVDDYVLGKMCFHGNAEIVKLLLRDHNVHPKSKNNFAIRCAIINNHMNIVQLLCNTIEVISSGGIDKALFIASTYNKKEIIRIMITNYVFDKETIDKCIENIKQKKNKNMYKEVIEILENCANIY